MKIDEMERLYWLVFWGRFWDILYAREESEQ